jgi:hypothetical protein
MKGLIDVDFVFPEHLLNRKHYVFTIHACNLIIAGEPKRTEALDEMEARLRSTMEAVIFDIQLQAKSFVVDAQAFSIALKDKLLDIAAETSKPRTLH